MRLEIFNDGSAMFAERKPTSDLTIEVNSEGYIVIGDKTYPIKDGVATIGKLPEGDYSISVVDKSKTFRACEHLIESPLGIAKVDGSHLWEIVLKLKEDYQQLHDDVAELTEMIKEHERKISGYSLFGD